MPATKTTYNFYKKLDPVTDVAFDTVIEFVDDTSGKKFISRGMCFACAGGTVEISFDGNTVAWEMFNGETVCFDNRAERRLFFRKIGIGAPVVRITVW